MLWTTEQTAKALQISPQTLRAWRYKGFGPPFVRIGPAERARVKYRIKDVEDWLEKRVQDPEAPAKISDGPLF